MGVEFSFSLSGALLAHVCIRPMLLEQIHELQMKDDELMKIRMRVHDGTMNEYRVRDDGILCLRNRVCVPNDKNLRRMIIDEAHSSLYAMHPGSTKMYRDLKEFYWWTGMKREIAECVSRCLTCQRVKVEHQKPAGLLQPLTIPEWKWENIAMDFVVGLPRSQKGYDSIWVIVDRLTKSAHFLPVKSTYPLERYAKLYIDEIVRLHGAPVSIVSDRDPRFTSRFWPCLQSALGTKLTMSTAFHPQTDGQLERTIQILEDMLR
jgi:Integrase core domain.